jgi:hypothetical protein
LGQNGNVSTIHAFAMHLAGINSLH